jgi:hypothetical protein
MLTGTSLSVHFKADGEGPGVRREAGSEPGGCSRMAGTGLALQRAGQTPHRNSSDWRSSPETHEVRGRTWSQSCGLS